MKTPYILFVGCVLVAPKLRAEPRLTLSSLVGGICPAAEDVHIETIEASASVQITWKEPRPIVSSDTKLTQRDSCSIQLNLEPGAKSRMRGTRVALATRFEFEGKGGAFVSFGHKASPLLPFEYANSNISGEISKQSGDQFLRQEFKNFASDCGATVPLQLQLTGTARQVKGKEPTSLKIQTFTYKIETENCEP